MYKWDINEVKKLLFKLERELATSPSSRADLERQIIELENLIDYYNQAILHSTNSRRVYFQKENFTSIISDDIKITKKFGTYFPIIRQFSESFDYSKIRPQDLPSRNSSSNTRIVSLTSAFYNNQSDIFKKTYARLSKHFTSRLNFNKPTGQTFLDGDTRAIYGTDLVFININKSNTIRDYITMIHEASHGITYLLNSDVIWDEEKYCFRELDSIFFEMIGAEYISHELDTPQDAQQIKVATFKDYLYSADLIVSKSDMYNALSPRELKNRRMITSFLKNEIGYDRIGIKDVMETYTREYIHYIISYLTAIELYLIYQEDQEYALNLLFKIIMLKNKDNHTYLEEIRKLGINPGKNTERYFKKLADDDKRLCYGRNIQL